jgi:hypothetical protein
MRCVYLIRLVPLKVIFTLSFVNVSARKPYTRNCKLTHNDRKS